MKTLRMVMIMTLSLSTLFLIVSQNASADSCSPRLTSYNAPQFYLLADGVFSGTVQHIDNTTDHQWKVYFTVDKLWKGSPSVKPLMIMTNTLQGCGYSIEQGEKYLVYTNGYPPFFNIVWSKPYADAQSDITIIDDSKFQSDEKIQVELNKKLEVAKDAISNLMGSKMGNIPFNAVGVDEINSTLDVGIDSAKATLSEGQYLEKIKEIVGDIPIKITFGQNVAGVGDDTIQKILSPLEQFKSGIDPYHITCKQDLQLVIKLKDNSPACVKSTSLARLLGQGWINAYNRNDNYNNMPQNNTVNSTSALKLDLSTDSDTIKPGQELGITISVSNTHTNPIDVPSTNNWSYGNVSTGPCSTIGYGVSILDGFYDVHNVTKGKNLDLFFPGTLCPVAYETAMVYEFQPSSDIVKEIQCKQIPGMTCPTESYQMGQTYKFNGYWDQGKVQPFSSGVKTLVGADEWGHVAIEHFVVSNSTIFAGDLGSMSCPLMYSGVQFGATVKNLTGFANYYNSTQYGYTLLLHPGMQGTINVQYKSTADAAWFENNGNIPLNMTNRAILSFMENVTEGKSIVPYAASLYNDQTGHHSRICHYNLSSGGGFMEPCDSDNTGNIPPGELPFASNALHVGIDASVKPSSVMLAPDTNPVFSGTVSVKPDAMPGVYWLDLARDRCSPGVFAKLVVLP